MSRARLKNNGYADSTVENYARILKVLDKRGASLWDPESVKYTIRHQSWSVGRKMIAVHAYSNFAKIIGLSWNPPKYKPPEKLPFIPQEREIDDLIAGCSLKISALLRLLKETGMRVGEAFILKWTDVDTVQKTVRVTPEKSSRPRIFKISNLLIGMLNRLSKNEKRLFDYSSKPSLRRTFEKQRRRVALKLNNPRIQRISFHTLRHWKATSEYHKTKDILHVMQLLGHKNIKNILKYTQLIDFEDNEFTCKVAQNIKEAKELIETGFEFVTDMDSQKLFRKRK
ncbi:MAG: site-specific integrase [Candidatus Bathyarchaeota archaeon]